MFNAITSMAGGGISDPAVVDNANFLLYIAVAITGPLSPAVVNLYGPKKALFAGTTGYWAYATALYYYRITCNDICSGEQTEGCVASLAEQVRCASLLLLLLGWCGCCCASCCACGSGSCTVSCRASCCAELGARRRTAPRALL